MKRYGSDPTSPESAADEQLRRENEELRRQIAELRGGGGHAHLDGPPARMWRPSRVTLMALLLGGLALFAVAFLSGYLPWRERQTVIRADSDEQAHTLPRVDVIKVGRSSRESDLKLPGSIQAVTEAPILARADGYVEKRLVDIGDHVKAGQPLAEIDAPELQQQVQQAKANLQQAQAALEQAQANLEQGRSDMDLARVTADRWTILVGRGVVSKQDNDQYQAQLRSKTATMHALEKAVGAQRSSVAAAEANLARLEQTQSYRIVRAPFAGIVTLRNVDTGALVTAGTTLLFRIAQTDVLRIYVNVPQSNSNSVRPGQPAVLTVANLPGREFHGTVARSSQSLDPASRTMLVEVQVKNADGSLLPGMYAQVDLSSSRTSPPLLVPSDALIVRSGGSQVAVVTPEHRMHLQKITVGRDYGDRLEVISGLKEGDTVVANPGDVAHEGMPVDPVAATAAK